MTDGELGLSFEDGQIIFREGDKANCLYVIQEGAVLIYQEKDGKDVRLAELARGSSFGDMGVFLGLIRTESARAVGAVRVITADYKFVLKKFRDDPTYAFQVIQNMARRNLVRKQDQEKVLELQSLRELELVAQNQELVEAGQESRDRNADYYDFAPVGAIDLDGNGIIRAINLAGAAVLGADRQDLMGVHFASFVPEEHQALFRTHLEACHGSTEGVLTELLLHTRGGDPTTVQLFSYPKQDPARLVYRTLMTELAVREPMCS